MTSYGFNKILVILLQVSILLSNYTLLSALAPLIKNCTFSLNNEILIVFKWNVFTTSKLDKPA